MPFIYLWFLYCSTMDYFLLFYIFLSFQLDGLEKNFYSFYVCTAVRKFFFFLDPMHTGNDFSTVFFSCFFSN